MDIRREKGRDLQVEKTMADMAKIVSAHASPKKGRDQVSGCVDRSLLVYYTLCKYSVEAFRNSVKVKVCMQVIKLL